MRAGDSLFLICDYDLENAPLYSIKWYFNSHEFYRFVPKEEPPTKVFPVPGITVDVSIILLTTNTTKARRLFLKNVVVAIIAIQLHGGRL